LTEIFTAYQLRCYTTLPLRNSKVQNYHRNRIFTPTVTIRSNPF